MSYDIGDYLTEQAKSHNQMYKMGLQHGKGEKMLIADFLKKIAIMDIDVNKTFIEVKICEKNNSKD